MLLVCSQSQPCDGQRTATEAGGPWSWEPAALTSSPVSRAPAHTVLLITALLGGVRVACKAMATLGPYRMTGWAWPPSWAAVLGRPAGHPCPGPPWRRLQLWAPWAAASRVPSPCYV